jgi:hypothetical protein
MDTSPSPSASTTGPEAGCSATLYELPVGSEGADRVRAPQHRPADGLDPQLAPLVHALGSAIAAYMDLAVAFHYGYSTELVDGWIDVLAGAGVNPVDYLGQEPVWLGPLAWLGPIRPHPPSREIVGGAMAG